MQKEPGFILAIRVTPSFLAISIESVVGTDLAATALAPILPIFAIISEEQRPLKMMILSVMSTLFLNIQPWSLSKTLWRPMSSRYTKMSCPSKITPLCTPFVTL